GGSFIMGDTWGDGFSDEKPTHKVELTYDFYVGKYPVTFDEYDRYCGETGSTKPSDSGWGRGRRPVINVSWNDAIEYCNWLSEKEGLPIAYYGDGSLLDENRRETEDITRVKGYRLLTEAEWEYAARGGKKSMGYKYSGSNSPDSVAWYRGNSGGKTHEVGQKKRNELGLCDMSGNVYEWCSDWYESYSSSAQTNPYNNSGSGRVCRGGGWGSFAASTRVAFRSFYTPTSALYDLGFRIARTVQ
ncbi:SUMF1/EgtB/PvdO family nonheme iron enzyme, partial [uncultured Mesotoga sp.]|uniref:formylglycine-generating enzyme family protein n=1 Tax=uncultured Mesotoga sp. TaxID=1184400 RepID=UPI00259895C8